LCVHQSDPLPVLAPIEHLVLWDFSLELNLEDDTEFLANEVAHLAHFIDSLTLHSVISISLSNSDRMNIPPHLTNSLTELVQRSECSLKFLRLIELTADDSFIPFFEAASSITYLASPNTNQVELFRLLTWASHPDPDNASPPRILPSLEVIELHMNGGIEDDEIDEQDASSDHD
jgi:hypothetical protein